MTAKKEPIDIDAIVAKALEDQRVAMKATQDADEGKLRVEMAAEIETVRDEKRVALATSEVAHAAQLKAQVVQAREEAERAAADHRLPEGSGLLKVWTQHRVPNPKRPGTFLRVDDPPRLADPVRVRATRIGFYDQKRWRDGDTFTIADRSQLGSWMAEVPDDTPGRITSGHEDLKAQHAEILQSKQPEVGAAVDAPTGAEKVFTGG